MTVTATRVGGGAPTETVTYNKAGRVIAITVTDSARGRSASWTQPMGQLWPIDRVQSLHKNLQRYVRSGLEPGIVRVTL